MTVTVLLVQDGTTKSKKNNKQTINRTLRD